MARIRGIAGESASTTGFIDMLFLLLITFMLAAGIQLETARKMMRINSDSAAKGVQMVTAVEVMVSGNIGKHSIERLSCNPEGEACSDMPEKGEALLSGLKKLCVRPMIKQVGKDRIEVPNQVIFSFIRGFEHNDARKIVEGYADMLPDCEVAY